MLVPSALTCTPPAATPSASPNSCQPDSQGIVPLLLVNERTSKRSLTVFVIAPESWIVAPLDVAETPSGRTSSRFTPVKVIWPVFATVIV